MVLTRVASMITLLCLGAVLFLFFVGVASVAAFIASALALAWRSIQ